MEKPFAQSCENNQVAILAELERLLESGQRVLEVGSGTGQHAVYFGARMPRLIWQTSDQLQYHPGISLWLNEAGLSNVLAPIELDVRSVDWSGMAYHAVFTANSLHIMAADAAEKFVRQVSLALRPGGMFIAYGPFNYKGAFSSESNARFDIWLKQQNLHSGIRDFEVLNQCALQGGMRLLEDITMPANNRLLVWEKKVWQKKQPVKSPVAQ